MRPWCRRNTSTASAPSLAVRRPFLARRGLEQGWVDIHQEHRACALKLRPMLGRLRQGGQPLGTDREVDPEGASPAGPALDGHRAAVRLDDAEDHGETQPRPTNLVRIPKFSRSGSTDAAAMIHLRKVVLKR